jgi:methyl-accepting chemotaxis protein
MEKAELGARIAEETAASLADIVEGINESTQIVGEIASSSEEQSIGISQVNTGIDQVAQVVQQNSATAEESAAASEEMSGQSSMLENLIAQFKLKNDAVNRRTALPSANKAPAPQPEIPHHDSAPDYGGDGDFGKY